MLPKCTTYLLLAAISFQGVFGGLKESVSICLGGGHEHEVAEVVEQCALECSHTSEWVTPVSSEDIQNCGCTDLDLGLVLLLSTPRAKDRVLELVSDSSFEFEFSVDAATLQAWRGPPTIHDDDIGMMHRIAVIRSTRLRV